MKASRAGASRFSLSPWLKIMSGWGRIAALSFGWVSGLLRICVMAEGEVEEGVGVVYATLRRVVTGRLVIEVDGFNGGLWFGTDVSHAHVLDYGFHCQEVVG